MPTDITLDAHSFNSAFKKYIDTLEQQSKNALFQTGQQVVNKIKRLAPVDTGRLRNSYVAVKEPTATGASVLIGSNVTYAKFVEYGTIHQHGQPHFRPAVESANTIWSTIMGGIGR